MDRTIVMASISPSLICENNTARNWKAVHTCICGYLCVCVYHSHQCREQKKYCKFKMETKDSSTSTRRQLACLWWFAQLVWLMPRPSRELGLCVGCHTYCMQWQKKTTVTAEVIQLLPAGTSAARWRLNHFYSSTCSCASLLPRVSKDGWGCRPNNKQSYGKICGSYANVWFWLWLRFVLWLRQCLCSGALKRLTVSLLCVPSCCCVCASVWVCVGSVLASSQRRLWGGHLSGSSVGSVGGLRSFSFSRCFMWHVALAVLHAAVTRYCCLGFFALVLAWLLVVVSLAVANVAGGAFFFFAATGAIHDVACDVEHMLLLGKSVHMWHATWKCRFFLLFASIAEEPRMVGCALLLLWSTVGPVWMLCRRMHRDIYTCHLVYWVPHEVLVNHRRVATPPTKWVLLHATCHSQLFLHLFVVGSSVGRSVGRSHFWLSCFCCSCHMCHNVSCPPFALKLLCTFALLLTVFRLLGCCMEISVMLIWLNGRGDFDFLLPTRLICFFKKKEEEEENEKLRLVSSTGDGAAFLRWSSHVCVCVLLGLKNFLFPIYHCWLAACRASVWVHELSGT